MTESDNARQEVAVGYGTMPVRQEAMKQPAEAERQGDTVRDTPGQTASSQAGGGGAKKKQINS